MIGAWARVVSVDNSDEWLQECSDALEEIQRAEREKWAYRVQVLMSADVSSAQEALDRLRAALTDNRPDRIAPPAPVPAPAPKKQQRKGSAVVGGLTLGELLTLRKASSYCFCGHGSNVHGEFCFVQGCACFCFERNDAHPYRAPDFDAQGHQII